MIIAGPCLINDDQREIDNAYKTAGELAKIDPDICFRAKIWGGGLTPEIYYPGIGLKGISILHNIQKGGMLTGTEIQCDSRLPLVVHAVDFVWIAARAMQSYGLLQSVGNYVRELKFIIIKRHFAAAEEETIGVHDICVEKHGYKPLICERGISFLPRKGQNRFIPDFRFMANVLRERPDIDLMFDPSHASFCRENVLPFVQAAKAIGVKSYMLEVYADTNCTAVDKQHALSVEDFKRIYDFLRKD